MAEEKKTISERAQRLLNNPELVDAMIKKRPGWFDKINDTIVPADVMLGTLMQNAMTGDKGSIELISKLAYGEHINVEMENSFFNQKELKIEIVEPNKELENLKGDDVK